MSRTQKPRMPLPAVSGSAGSLLLFFLFVLLASCGGGGNNPTSPMPPSGRVTLAGTWQGTMTGNRLDTGQAIRCQAIWNLQDTGDPDFAVGDWSVDCDDGTRGGDILTVTRALFIVVVVGFPDDPFFGCAWSSNASQGADTLSGPWSSEGTQCTIPIRGTFEVRKV